MKNWRDHKKLEKMPYIDKIGRRHKKTPKTAELEEEFELDEVEWPELISKKSYFPGRIVEVQKRYAFVSSEPTLGQIQTKDVWLATVARKFLVAKREQRNLVCVGDRVLCSQADQKEKHANSDLPQCVIQYLSPRKSEISRIDPSFPERRHILASNIDQILVVASYKNPKIKWGLIDRYLVLAEREGLPAIIALTKRDLLEGDSATQKEYLDISDGYRTLGYNTLNLQANIADPDSDPAIQDLKQLLENKITLLSGHSGVGKSSLVNIFEPEIIQTVEPDDDIFYKGRHTTVFSSLIKLGAVNGYVIDTPGIRSFLIHELDAITLTDCFLEMRTLVGKCKYRECRHIDEPECAVREAVKAGKIQEWRYKSYLGILLGATGREGRLRDIDVDDA